ncbi:MAG: DUF4250 domain-containing protein [Lachnospiraceae bacterium]|nr:DUF4250 domain-containing protein [Lachnospiraceae bacterium]
MHRYELPADPVMLLSLVNMRLRDYNEDLDELCADFGIAREELEEKLRDIDYEYDDKLRRFV